MRRLFVSVILTVASLSLVAEEPKGLYEIELKTIEGKAAKLKDYEGDVLLIVNVASECGLTPQYSKLQEVFAKYQEKGFKVLGFPCNDFGKQEPGTNKEIKQFCTTRYQVTFPMFEKLHVKGDNQHPLYKALTGETSPFPGNVIWNFGKFLVNRDGKIIHRFKPKIAPDHATVTEAIEKALE